MKVLITGVSGLIGRWTAETLSRRGARVCGLDRRDLPKGIKLYQHLRCDILDKSELARIMRASAPDMVIHLAARTDLDDTRIEGYAANIDGVRNLLSAIRATPSVRRAIFTSSQLVCRPGFVPKTAQEYSPHTLYGESKVLTEKIVREENGGGVDWCLVRPTTVWGPHMGPHYQRMLELVRRGRYFHCGKGRMLKSYSYVGNIAAQYSALLEAPASAIGGGTFYLADYIPLSLRDYADELAKAMNSPSIPTLPLPVARALAHIGDVLNGAGWRAFPFNSFRLRNILTEYVFDLRPTSDVCGPLPYTFREGVESTGKWYMDLKNSNR